MKARLLALALLAAAPALAQEGGSVAPELPSEGGGLIGEPSGETGFVYTPREGQTGDFSELPGAEGLRESLRFEPFNVEEEGGFVGELPETEEMIRERVESVPAGVLRGLDKITAEVRDIALEVGASAEFGRYRIELGDCRAPVENPAGNAYAHVIITGIGEDIPRFNGWMVAASPALNAFDDPRYDIWVLRCKSS